MARRMSISEISAYYEGSCRLISVQPLIGLTIRAFSIDSALWVLEVLCCPY